MVGKLFFLDDGPILKTVEGDFFIKNNIEKKIKNICLEYGYVWVEYEKNTKQLITLTKFYDVYFGTTKESVSIATNRYENNKYPMGGFLHGFSNKKCLTCGSDYIGDKGSTECEPCGINNLIYKTKTYE